jgi:hypothetical protein
VLLLLVCYLRTVLGGFFLGLVGQEINVTCKRRGVPQPKISLLFTLSIRYSKVPHVIRIVDWKDWVKFVDVDWIRLEIQSNSINTESYMPGREAGNRLAPTISC